jgi:hypothetical protein
MFETIVERTGLSLKTAQASNFNPPSDNPFPSHNEYNGSDTGPPGVDHRTIEFDSVYNDVSAQWQNDDLSPLSGGETGDWLHEFLGLNSMATCNIVSSFEV